MPNRFKDRSILFNWPFRPACPSRKTRCPDSQPDRGALSSLDDLSPAAWRPFPSSRSKNNVFRLVPPGSASEWRTGNPRTHFSGFSVFSQVFLQTIWRTHVQEAKSKGSKSQHRLCQPTHQSNTIRRRGFRPMKESGLFEQVEVNSLEVSSHAHSTVLRSRHPFRSNSFPLHFVLRTHVYRHFCSRNRNNVHSTQFVLNTHKSPSCCIKTHNMALRR